MRAIRFHAHGGPEVLRLEEVPRPDPGPGEARVDVRAVGVNHLDLWVRRGLPLRIEMPHVPGTDFAGVVSALGPGAGGLAVGDRVVGYPVLAGGGARSGPGPLTILGEQRSGACRESLVLPAANLVPIPEGIDDVTAAAVPVAYLTAWTMLAERARLAAGETVLVQGAGSGVGTAAIQIARHLGARVVACARSAAKAERARALGADIVIDTTEGRLHRRVRAATGGRGAEVVFEHVGAATWEESLRAAAYGGRIVICGATSGPSARTDLRQVFGRELAIQGVTLGSVEGLRTVLGLVASGALRPVIDRVLELAECRAAHELLESGRVFGKLVLRVGPAGPPVAGPQA